MNHTCRNLAQKYGRLINEWIEQACLANGVPELAKLISWSFNARFSRRMGDANCITNEIRFSAPLWERAGDEEQRNTTKHETAHLIARKLYGFGIKSHGREWKACMYNTGETTNRCHSVNRDGLRRKTKRYPAACFCKTWQLTNIRRKRMRQGATYTCPKCKEPLRLT